MYVVIIINHDSGCNNGCFGDYNHIWLITFIDESVWCIFVLADAISLDSGALCNKAYPSEIHLKLKSREISFPLNSCFSWPIALKFCTEQGNITGQLKQMLWTNDISRDLRLRWVSDGYPILHSAPGVLLHVPSITTDQRVQALVMFMLFHGYDMGNFLLISPLN